MNAHRVICGQERLLTLEIRHAFVCNILTVLSYAALAKSLHIYTQCRPNAVLLFVPTHALPGLGYRFLIFQPIRHSLMPGLRTFIVPASQDVGNPAQPVECVRFISSNLTCMLTTEEHAYGRGLVLCFSPSYRWGPSNKINTSFRLF